MALLKMNHIKKSFFGVTVLDQVSISLEKGEIHALLGENGAGKSTLMNVLGGIYKPEGGNVEFDGKDITKITPIEAQRAGIGFVHQELNLFNDLRVYENVFLTEEIETKYRKLDKKKMIEECRALFEKLNIKIKPTAMVAEIDAASKQLVEIAKVLHKKAKLIILDEPTTSLNHREIETLFDIMRGLKAKGTSFIYISHKMPEIFEICDRYTVLRNGLFIEEGNICDTDTETVTKLMVGGNFENKNYYVSTNFKESILKVKNISGLGFKDISFTLNKGEVIAFTGLQGSGGSELLESLFGYTSITRGEIHIRDEVITKTKIKKSMKAGISLVPRNRKENGIISNMNLLDNMMISKYVLTHKKQYIDGKKEQKDYQEMKDKINIKANRWSDLITSLSGGNQQKIIIGRWLSTHSDIYIFDNPTQGIDVGAKAEIYKLIAQLVESGKSVIINTLVIPEIQKIANRCYVLYHGSVIKELPREEMSEEKIMLYATNAVKEN